MIDDGGEVALKAVQQEVKRAHESGELDEEGRLGEGERGPRAWLVWRKGLATSRLV